MAQRQNVHFIKGYANLLDALFQLQYHTRFCEILQEVEELQNNKHVTDLFINLIIQKFEFFLKLERIFWFRINLLRYIELLIEKNDSQETNTKFAPSTNNFMNH